MQGRAGPRLGWRARAAAGGRIAPRTRSPGSCSICGTPHASLSPCHAGPWPAVRAEAACCRQLPWHHLQTLQLVPRWPASALGHAKAQEGCEYGCWHPLCRYPCRCRCPTQLPAGQQVETGCPGPRWAPPMQLHLKGAQKHLLVERGVGRRRCRPHVGQTHGLPLRMYNDSPKYAHKVPTSSQPQSSQNPTQCSQNGSVRF